MSESDAKSGSNIPKTGAGKTDKNTSAGSPASASASAPAKPKRGVFGRLVLWTFLLAFAAAAAGAVTFKHWRPYAEPHIAALLSKLEIQAAAPAPNSAQNELLAALTARVETLEQAQSAGAGTDAAALKSRLEAVESALEDVRAMAAAAQTSGGGTGGTGGTGESGETPAAVTETLTRINKRLADLEHAASDTSLAARLDALETKTAETGPEGAGVLMVALGDLRAAMADGAPYKDVLAMAAAVAGAAPEDALRRLETCAENGAPAVSSLREDFRTAAREAARLRAAADDDSGWMNAVAAKASAIISVRRIGRDAAPETLDGRLARAERALEDGDVTAAVKALESLSGAPGAAVQPWLETARARLVCEQGLTALSAAAAARLGGG